MNALPPRQWDRAHLENAYNCLISNQIINALPGEDDSEETVARQGCLCDFSIYLDQSNLSENQPFFNHLLATYGPNTHVSFDFRLMDYLLLTGSEAALNALLERDDTNFNTSNDAGDYPLELLFMYNNVCAQLAPTLGALIDEDRILLYPTGTVNAHALASSFEDNEMQALLNQFAQPAPMEVDDGALAAHSA